MSGSSLRSKLDQAKGKRENILSNIKTTNIAIKEIEKEVRCVNKAQLIIQTVAEQTQKQLEFKISDLVSTALSEIVNQDPYNFQVEFVQQRNSTEAMLYFVSKRSKEKLHPLKFSGYGAVDVASTFLRPTLWNIRRKKFRNTFLFDEPDKHLKERRKPSGAKTMSEKFGSMLKLISEELNVQIIMISHTNEVIEEADKIFSVKKVRNGLSKISIL